MKTPDFTLNYGAPIWHKTKYRKPTDEGTRVKILAGGLSEDVAVAVYCENGVQFVAMDRYDKFTDSWELHTEEKGQHVIAWAKIEVPWVI